jgi:hypothetical protein
VPSLPEDEDSEDVYTPGDSSDSEFGSGDEPNFRRYGLSPERVYVIPNAIVANQFKPSESLPTGDKGKCLSWP